MFRLRRWYNQNRKEFWKVVGIIALIIIVLQIINFIYSKKNEEQLKNSNKQTEKNEYKEYNSLVIGDSTSGVTGQTINGTQEKKLKVLDNFIQFCNEQKVEEAYNLLTNECKEEMYPNIESFTNNYYNNIFGGKKKNVSIENWIDDTYKVKIMEDSLSTGVYDTENVIQDYITIKDTEDNVYKLNINNYIGAITLSEIKEDKNIKVEVLKKDIYMDYITYDFKITNNTKNQILMDDLTNLESMYITDNKGIKYYAYTHELTQEELLIKPGEERELTIKYYCKYISTKQIKEIEFSKIILDYDMYTIIDDLNVYNNYYDYYISI